MAYRRPWQDALDDDDTSPAASPARSYPRHEAQAAPASGAWSAARVTPGSQQRLRIEREHHLSTRESPRGAARRAGSPAASSPKRTRHDQLGLLRASVESFLQSLPLGDDPDSAEVEARVAERLYEEEAARASLQERLQQWSDVAMELYNMAAERATPSTAPSSRPDPATLSAIKSAIGAFVRSSQQQQQQQQQQPRSGQPPAPWDAPPPSLPPPQQQQMQQSAVQRRLAAGSSRSSPLATPTTHHPHTQRLQFAQQQPPSASSAVPGGAMSTPRGPLQWGAGAASEGGAGYGGGGGGAYGEEQRRQRDAAMEAEVAQLRLEVQRLRSELARDQQQRSASPGSQRPVSPGRGSIVPWVGTSSGGTSDPALAAAVMMQAALMPKAASPSPLALSGPQQSAQLAALRAELEVARVAVAERGAQAAAASDEAQRLRRALLDAEIELQQASVAGEAARKQLAQAEDDMATLRANASRLAAELEVERSKAAAVVTAVSGKAEEAASVRQQLSSALGELQLVRAELGAREVEVAELGGRLAARTGELAAAQQQVAALRAAAAEAQLLPLVQQERDSASRRAEQAESDLAAAREELRRLQADVAAAAAVAAAAVAGPPSSSTSPRAAAASSPRSSVDLQSRLETERATSASLLRRVEQLSAALETRKQALDAEQRRRHAAEEAASRAVQEAERAAQEARAAGRLSEQLMAARQEVERLRQQLAAAMTEAAAERQEAEEAHQQEADRLRAAAAASAAGEAAEREAAAMLRGQLAVAKDAAAAAQDVAAASRRDADTLREQLQHAHRIQLEQEAQRQQGARDTGAMAAAVKAAAEREAAERQAAAALRNQLAEARDAAAAAQREAEQLRQQLADAEMLHAEREATQQQEARDLAAAAAVAQAAAAKAAARAEQLEAELAGSQERAAGLEGLVPQLKQQLSELRRLLQDAEERAAAEAQRAGAAGAAEAEAAEAAAAQKRVQQELEAERRRVSELQAALQQLRLREEALSASLEDSVRQSGERADTIHQLQEELRAAEQLQQRVVIGLQRAASDGTLAAAVVAGAAAAAAATSPRDAGSGSRWGSEGGGSDRAAPLEALLSGGSGVRSSGGSFEGVGGMARGEVPSPSLHQQLRAALTVARQRIASLEEQLSSRTAAAQAAAAETEALRVRLAAAEAVSAEAAQQDAEAEASLTFQLTHLEQRLAQAQAIIVEQAAQVALLEQELRLRSSESEEGERDYDAVLGLPVVAPSPRASARSLLASSAASSGRNGGTVRGATAASGVATAPGTARGSAAWSEGRSALGAAEHGRVMSGLSAGGGVGSSQELVLADLQEQLRQSNDQVLLLSQQLSARSAELHLTARDAAALEQQLQRAESGRAEALAEAERAAGVAAAHQLHAERSTGALLEARAEVAERDRRVAELAASAQQLQDALAAAVAADMSAAAAADDTVPQQLLRRSLELAQQFQPLGPAVPSAPEAPSEAAATLRLQQMRAGPGVNERTVSGGGQHDIPQSESAAPTYKLGDQTQSPVRSSQGGMGKRSAEWEGGAANFASSGSGRSGGSRSSEAAGPHAERSATQLERGSGSEASGGVMRFNSAGSGSTSSGVAGKAVPFGSVTAVRTNSRSATEADSALGSGQARDAAALDAELAEIAAGGGASPPFVPPLQPPAVPSREVVHVPAAHAGGGGDAYAWAQNVSREGRYDDASDGSVQLGNSESGEQAAAADASRQAQPLGLPPRSPTSPRPSQSQLSASHRRQSDPAAIHHRVGDSLDKEFVSLPALASAPGSRRQSAPSSSLAANHLVAHGEQYPQAEQALGVRSSLESLARSHDAPSQLERQSFSSSVFDGLGSQSHTPRSSIAMATEAEQKHSFPGAFDQSSYPSPHLSYSRSPRVSSWQKVDDGRSGGSSLLPGAGAGRSYNTAEHEAMLAAIAASLGGGGGAGVTVTSGDKGGHGDVSSGSSASSTLSGQDQQIISELRDQLSRLERALPGQRSLEPAAADPAPSTETVTPQAQQVATGSVGASVASTPEAGIWARYAEAALSGDSAGASSRKPTPSPSPSPSPLASAQPSRRMSAAAGPSLASRPSSSKSLAVPALDSQNSGSQPRLPSQLSAAHSRLGSSTTQAGRSGGFRDNKEPDAVDSVHAQQGLSADFSRAPARHSEPGPTAGSLTAAATVPDDANDDPTAAVRLHTFLSTRDGRLNVNAMAGTTSRYGIASTSSLDAWDMQATAVGVGYRLGTGADGKVAAAAVAKPAPRAFAAVGPTPPLAARRSVAGLPLTGGHAALQRPIGLPRDNASVAVKGNGASGGGAGEDRRASAPAVGSTEETAMGIVGKIRSARQSLLQQSSSGGAAASQLGQGSSRRSFRDREMARTENRARELQAELDALVARAGLAAGPGAPGGVLDHRHSAGGVVSSRATMAAPRASGRSAGGRRSDDSSDGDPRVGSPADGGSRRVSFPSSQRSSYGPGQEWLRQAEADLAEAVGGGAAQAGDGRVSGAGGGEEEEEPAQEPHRPSPKAASMNTYDVQQYGPLYGATYGSAGSAKSSEDGGTGAEDFASGHGPGFSFFQSSPPVVRDHQQHLTSYGSAGAMTSPPPPGQVRTSLGSSQGRLSASYPLSADVVIPTNMADLDTGGDEALTRSAEIGIAVLASAEERPSESPYRTHHSTLPEHREPTFGGALSGSPGGSEREWNSEASGGGAYRDAEPAVPEVIEDYGFEGLIGNGGAGVVAETEALLRQLEAVLKRPVATAQSAPALSPTGRSSHGSASWRTGLGGGASFPGS